jgi:hypothetical protein
LRLKAKLFAGRFGEFDHFVGREKRLKVHRNEKGKLGAEPRGSAPESLLLRRFLHEEDGEEHDTFSEGGA